jgi:carboxylate-amine ligase
MNSHASSHDYTIGIEEEFFLASMSTGQIASRVPRSFVQACRQVVGDRATHEMLQSQIETSTPICRFPGELAASVRDLRREVAGIAAAYGLVPVASGTFPLAEWREQTHTEKPRYLQLVNDFQIVGRRNLMCGLHVHVGLPPGIDRVDVMNRLMAWLPVFLALSASSPFWNRQDTGLASYRQAAYDEWPRTGIPDFFAGESDYDAFARGLVQSGVIPDASQLWWAIRPSARYPTLELRITDACTHVDDALCLANLFRCLVRATVRDPDLGRARTSVTRMLIEENRWQAKRHGKDAEFVDELRTGRRQRLAERLDDLIALTAPDADHLGCRSSVQHARRILERGTSADQQRAVYRQARDRDATRLEACRAVVQWLMKNTLPSPVDERIPVDV